MFTKWEKRWVVFIIGVVRLRWRKVPPGRTDQPTTMSLAVLHRLNLTSTNHYAYIFLFFLPFFHPLTDDCRNKNENHTTWWQLGAGAFSVVKEGTNKKLGGTYAIKIVTKAKLTPEDEAALNDEIAVLRELKHPNIIRLYDVFDEKQYYYLVTECMNGGELFDRIVQKSYYNEKEARDTCLVLFKALQFCHDHKVAHRDLKPENLLLSVRCDNGVCDVRSCCCLRSLASLLFLMFGERLSQ
jgi:hypothetical protein